MRLLRIVAFAFASLAVGAFGATVVIDEAYPDLSEGWGLLFWLVACAAGLTAAVCGLVVGVRVYRIHQSRVGRPVMVIVGGVLLVWLGRSLFHF